MYDDYAVFIKEVDKNYGSKEILKKLGMKVERGIIYGLLGASGCGKTTLLSCIVGRKNINGGEIWVLGGKPGEPESGVPGPRIGYMPQDIALVREFTVKDAVYYFGRIFGMENGLIVERFEYLKQLLDLPSDNKFLKDCSGGQQRRVSFAAALVNQPELLILDEPTAGVDPLLRDRIWNHLVDITKKENISVIITTHYIEEARQANKIGLMREGRLLAEESPEKLLTIFNTSSLEEVFLILSRKQEEGRLDETSFNSSANDQSNFIVENVGSTSMKSSSLQIETTGSNDMLTKKYKKKAIDGSRLKALLDKNWKQFYRNVTGIMFLLTFPLIQTSLFMSAVGGNIKDIPLGIINDELMSVSCPNFNPEGTAIPYGYSSCHFHNMSCRFLTYLDDTMIKKVQYYSIEKAMDGVRHGDIVGVMYFSKNFTRFAEERVEKGKDVDDEVLNLSQIKVWMDMSNRQIGATLQYKLIDLYDKFQKSVFKECKFIQGFSNFPITIDSMYGQKDDPYTVFMTPGAMLTIIFFLGSLMTCQIILTDRHDGVWDRSIVAGVTSLEITISHFTLQLCVSVIQSLEVLLVVYIMFEQENRGSLSLIYLFILSQGICGMAYGFWVSVVSSNHSMANTILTGIFLPMMMLSGLMWPTEGMPPILRIFAKCLPFTIPIESLRNVAKRGWAVSNFYVYDGLLVTLIWTAFFGMLSIYLIKYKR